MVQAMVNVPHELPGTTWKQPGGSSTREDLGGVPSRAPMNGGGLTVAAGPITPASAAVASSAAPGLTAIRNSSGRPDGVFVPGYHTPHCFGNR